MDLAVSRPPHLGAAMVAMLGGRSSPDAGDVTALRRATMARTLGYVFAAGGTILLLGDLLPNPDEVQESRVAIIAASSYGMALLLLLGYRRLPEWSFPVFLACGTLLTEWAIYIERDPSAPYAMFYFWIAIYAFYFLSRVQAVLQVVFIACAYAAVLGFASDASSEHVVRWITTSSSLVVAGAMIGLLKSHVDQLAEAARIDTETGLLNHRGFREHLDTDLERVRRSGGSVSVLAGEVFADSELGPRDRRDSLELAAGAVNGSKRRMDSAARIDDRRFAVLLPDTDDAGAAALAERTLRMFRESAAGRTPALRLSLGAATFPKDGTTPEGVMYAAGQALVAAQRLGGDNSVPYSVEISKALFTAMDGGGDATDAAAVLALANVLDIRDTGTASHSQTVGRYSEAIAQELGLPDAMVERLRLGGVVHDVGKIAVPDSVLQKPSALTDEEFARIRQHPETGAAILEGADLDDISLWVRAHHERPDGRGYPDGLAGEAIPLGARILAVADSFEAMTAERVYSPAMPLEDAREELLRCAGTQFDPRVVDALLSHLDREDQRSKTREAAAGVTG